MRRGHNSGFDPIPEITDIREVTRADLAHLTVKRGATVVQTLRDNHHRIARAVASGMSNADVAATCGVTISRVNSLRGDPAFVELVAHYRAILTTEWAQADTVIEFMRTNALKAQAMISDKLDDAAERNDFLPTRDLLGIAELGLDSTGYGKVNKNINVNVDFAAKLEAARSRASRAPTLRILELQSTAGAAGATPANRSNPGNVEASRLAASIIEAQCSPTPQSVGVDTIATALPSRPSFRRV
jgi:hypothetical protein